MDRTAREDPYWSQRTSRKSVGMRESHAFNESRAPKRPLSERSINQQQSALPSSQSTKRLRNSNEDKSVYAIQKEALIKELRKVNEHRRELEEQVLALKSECRNKTEALKNISPQLEAEYESLLENYGKLEHQLADVNEELSVRNDEYDRLAESLCRERELFDDAQAQLNEFQKTKEVNQTQTEELRQRLDQIEAELGTKISELENVSASYDELCEESMNTHQKLENLNIKVDDLIAERDSLVVSKEDLGREIEHFKSLCESRAERCDALEAQLSQVNIDHDRVLVSQTADHTRALESLRTEMQSEIEHARDELNSKQQEHEMVTAELDSVKHKLSIVNDKLQAEMRDRSRLREVTDEQISLRARRLNEQEAEISELRTGLQGTKQQNKKLGSENKSLREEVAALTAKLASIEGLHAIQEREVATLREENQLYDSQRTELALGYEKEKYRSESLDAHNKHLEKMYSALQTQLESQATEHEHQMSQLFEQIQEKNNAIDDSQLQVSILRDELETACSKNMEDPALVERQRAPDLAKISELEKEISKLTELVKQERKTARRLQNQIQELKGNIRIVARVRPPTNVATKSGTTANLKLNSDEIVLSETEKTPNGGERSKAMKVRFDRVFGSEASNAAVCEEMEYLMQSAIEGRNVCILAYGQTGSGKTYTMSGKDGVNAYALKSIMNEANTSPGKYQITVESVEIYNEHIYDLLSDVDLARTGGTTNTKPQLKPSIQQDPRTGQPELTNIQRVAIGSEKTAAMVLDKAMRSRSIAATQANERSSRSHFVFSIRITTASTCGVLHLVDLAGSERLTHSQTDGDRLKETQAINTSLSSLGNVINALLNRRPSTHIPYRSSKLTYLLQSSLSVGAKTMLLTTLSPERSSIEETKSTLRFAEKASRTTLK